MGSLHFLRVFCRFINRFSHATECRFWWWRKCVVTLPVNSRCICRPRMAREVLCNNTSQTPTRGQNAERLAHDELTKGKREVTARPNVPKTNRRKQNPEQRKPRNRTTGKRREQRTKKKPDNQRDRNDNSENSKKKRREQERQLPHPLCEAKKPGQSRGVTKAAMGRTPSAKPRNQDRPEGQRRAAMGSKPHTGHEEANG